MHPHITAVVKEMGASDPVSAVRAKARRLIQRYVATFDETPPFNLEALASFLGLVVSEEAPRHSLDSEIAPEGGRVVLRINRSRPLVRQRFSIGHEIGHTLFPDYHLAVRCRKPPGRELADSSDQIETLCDIAASEILFPSPWFDDAMKNMAVSASGLKELAIRFAASPEATIRRFVDLAQQPMAAVFCSWKLKPTELRRRAADKHQVPMFNDALPAPASKLRVDYSILNDAFRNTCGDHVPKDKSVPWEGPIVQAAQRQEPSDGTTWMDLGSLTGTFTLHALPVFTPEDRLGPQGQVSVVLVIRPE